MKNVCGSGGIRTHAPEETGALNQRLRPLGHATLLRIQRLFSVLNSMRKQIRVEYLLFVVIYKTNKNRTLPQKSHISSLTKLDMANNVCYDAILALFKKSRNLTIYLHNQ